MNAHLRVIPGTGLVSRTDRFLIWADEGSIDIAELAESAGDAAFKRVGAAVLEADFDMPAFAIVDLERSTALVFGAAVLQTGSEALDGATSSTWIERGLESCENLALNVASGSPDESTNLLLGAVRGAGWALGEIVSAESEAADSGAEGSTESRGPELDKEAAAKSKDAEAEGAEFEQVDLVTEAQASAPSAPGPQEGSVYQDSVSVDLVVDGADSETETDMFEGDLTQVAKPSLSAPATMVWDSTATDETTDSEERQEALGVPESPMRSPGVPRLRPVEQQPEDLIPAPRESIRVKFDDGQEITVDRGVYVGRNPTKRGVPDGYDTITIRSEHVSRVHWELDLAGRTVLLRDLGSASGLTLTSDGLEPMQLDSGAEAILEGNVRIDFADRHAEIAIRKS